MASIYLFREHENYQPGKSSLKKGAVFDTNIIMISLILIVGLGLLVLGGNSLRLQWRYLQVGQESSGIVTACDEHGSKGGYTTYVSYSYNFNGKFYTGRDNLGAGRLCGNYLAGLSYPVYYLSDAPHESGVGAFLHENDWQQSMLAGGPGIAAVIWVFSLFMQNRKQRYQHALLQKRAKFLVEAYIERVGKVPGKNGYDFADYVFASPDMGLQHGRIRTGMGYRFPKNLQKQDTLMVLYYDMHNYCVL